MRKINLFFRHFRNDRLFSLINIFGFAIGFSACLLISMFVVDEYGYDKYNKNFKNIYRIVCDIHINGNNYFYLGGRLRGRFFSRQAFVIGGTRLETKVTSPSDKHYYHKYTIINKSLLKIISIATFIDNWF
jgi:hypothetical protein